MNLVYKVNDKPKFGQLIVFALQQLLAILAATIAVPSIVGNGMSQSAALFGAGVGTIVYLLFTKFKSPVFLGSSFAFLGSMFAAFGGAASTAVGYAGLVIGAVFAGLVYVIIAIIVKYAGVAWIRKLMPAVVIGPTVAIIGLSLAGNAIGDALKGAVLDNGTYIMNTQGWVSLICALVTLLTVVFCSVKGKKMMKLIPFIIGIVAGYIVALIFTLIGNASGNDALKVLDFTAFSSMKWVPEFTFIKAFEGFQTITAKYILSITVAYVPVAFVVFAEHIADHKNLSTIIDQDLLEEPGLHRTLLGDGIGSMAGAFFGGCPNTTYGESVGCVAITGNASVITILCTAIIAIAASFFAPFVTFLSTIPSCVMGGVCITLYGFIAVSGLKMLQPVDLNDNRNLFTASVILIAGIGGMTLKIGSVTITEIACALILGIIVNLLFNRPAKNDQ
ncbi:uracil-xanthine permease family protein [Aristaeella hokkaidonensis]|uniref:Uracil-xanthine permease n=1 Tax=Aristaeella hokkaidonensis TaxID=3046382 RepID=A0AC61MYF3_9FIRM|nr:solute carrier family 23 protein [Aristaeella hokkaidonensis]QUC68061.1 uracil-xanthine permease [Aristaeella hokkaidonensis]SNT93132.1 uracil permease [Aristaeella hokkaidonensis]